MISVVLATYNGARFLDAQLQSLAAQTRAADEVILTDDASTDETVAVCRDFIAKNGLTSWRILEHKENVGYCRNFFRGLQQAAGDLVFLCDQDDVWAPEKLKVMAEFMENHPTQMLLGCRYRLINAAGLPDADLTVPHYVPLFDGSYTPIPFSDLIGHSFVRGCSCCVRRAVLEKAKPMELKDLLGHDWQLAALAALIGKAGILNLPLMDYRCHDGNASFSAKPVRRLQKRINGITQSVAGHRFLLPLISDPTDRAATEKFIRFEQKRIRFLESGNPFIGLALGFARKQYRRYYAGHGLRVWLGDWAYAYKGRN